MLRFGGLHAGDPESLPEIERLLTDHQQVQGFAEPVLFDCAAEVVGAVLDRASGIEPGQGAFDVFSESFDRHTQGGAETGYRFPVSGRECSVFVERGDEPIQGREMTDHITDAGRLGEDEDLFDLALDAGDRFVHRRDGHLERDLHR